MRDGDEKAALESIVDFFRLARTAIVQHVNANHASALMVYSLNTHIRPFTARWHRQALDGSLSSLDQRFKFRSELQKLQRVLRVLAGVLGTIVDAREAKAFLVPFADAALDKDSAPNRLKYGILESGIYKEQIKAVNSAETKEILLRRGCNISDNEVHDVTGLSISGGGIRSATFALGIVQVLSRRGILGNVDIISTVSGGGYLGGFISSTLNDDNCDVGLKPGQQPFGKSAGVESDSIRYLRNHSKYLAEGGKSTLALIAFSAAYGILMSIVLIAPYLLLAAVVAVQGFGFGTNEDGWIPPGFTEWITTSILYVLGGVVAVTSVVRSRTLFLRLQRVAAFLFVTALILMASQVFTPLKKIVASEAQAFLGAVILIPIIAGSVVLWKGATHFSSRVALASLALVGPVFFGGAWLAVVDGIIYLKSYSAWAPFFLTAIAFIYSCYGVNINFASLHLYYRDRLSRTYLQKISKPGPENIHLLSKMNEYNKAPLHLINATLNIPGSKNCGLRGRNADFFTFGKHYCGGPIVGWWPTLEWEKADPHLDMGTAMAISGAAAAPRMGTLTSSRYTAILAILNVRLGYWLHRPIPKILWNKLPGAPYFIREITGAMDEKARFINLSDAGHLENLGIYELLRRQCRYVIAIDGEADGEHQFSGLLNALQMAKIDLGVHVEPDLTDLRMGQEQFKRAHFVMTRINYGSDVNGKPVYGLLLILKLALTGNEPELLLKYKRENSDFPHQSTSQQLFNESQFEAYRSLGEHTADSAFDPLFAGDATSNVVEWMRQLENTLLSPHE